MSTASSRPVTGKASEQHHPLLQWVGKMWLILTVKRRVPLRRLPLSRGLGSAIDWATKRPEIAVPVASGVILLCANFSQRLFFSPLSLDLMVYAGIADVFEYALSHVARTLVWSIVLCAALIVLWLGVHAYVRWLRSMLAEGVILILSGFGTCLLTWFMGFRRLLVWFGFSVRAARGEVRHRYSRHRRAWQQWAQGERQKLSAGEGMRVDGSSWRQWVVVLLVSGYSMGSLMQAVNGWEIHGCAEYSGQILRDPDAAALRGHEVPAVCPSAQSRLRQIENDDSLVAWTALLLNSVRVLVFDKDSSIFSPTTAPWVAVEIKEDKGDPRIIPDLLSLGTVGDMHLFYDARAQRPVVVPHAGITAVHYTRQWAGRARATAVAATDPLEHYRAVVDLMLAQNRAQQQREQAVSHALTEIDKALVELRLARGAEIDLSTQFEHLTTFLTELGRVVARSASTVDSLSEVSMRHALMRRIDELRWWWVTRASGAPCRGTCPAHEASPCPDPGSCPPTPASSWSMDAGWRIPEQCRDLMDGGYFDLATPDRSPLDQQRLDGLFHLIVKSLAASSAADPHAGAAVIIEAFEYDPVGESLPAPGASQVLRRELGSRWTRAGKLPPPIVVVTRADSILHVDSALPEQAAVPRAHLYLCLPGAGVDLAAR